MLNELYYLLRVLITPSCWIRNYPTNNYWDRSVRLNLKNPDFTLINRCEVRLNGKKIWIANHPYASVTDAETHNDNVMPSRRTVFMFGDALDKYISEL